MVVVLLATALTGCSALAAPAPVSPSAVGATPTAGPAPASGTFIDRAVPASVAAIPLVDQDGHTVTLAALKGKTIVLADFLTTCREVCPLTSANLQRVAVDLQKAGLGSQVQIIEVTVDPGRDDPKRLAAYQKLFGPEPGWTFLTGTPSNVAALWSFIGVAYQQVPQGPGAPPTDWLTGAPLTYDVEHQDVAVVLGPDLHERWVVAAMPKVVSGSALPGPLQNFLSPTGLSNESAPADLSWTAQDVARTVAIVSGHPVG